MNKDKDEILQHGLIAKGASVKSLTLSDVELEKINKHTLSPLKAEDVYVFKVAICDNEVDRQYEQFSDNAIKQMADLFIGKPLIKDHDRKADNQIGRIYDTEVNVSTDTFKEDGSAYITLVAHCYVLDTDTNKDLIAEIKGGIKKEVSVNLRVAKSVCNICGTDNAQRYCDHWWGRTYEGVKCFFTLDEPVDAFEVSFVAVPAQAKAGTLKEQSFKEKEMPAKTESTETDSAEDALSLKLKSIDAFLFINNQKGKKEQ